MLYSFSKFRLERYNTYFYVSAKKELDLHHNFKKMFTYILLGFLGGQEVILIVVALLLMFGGKKIPELMRGLGKGMKEFKDASNGETKEDKDTPAKS